MKFRNSLIILISLLAAQTAIAYDFQEDGIYYNILPSEEAEVEVASGPDSYFYKGDIVIPSEVTHEKVTYKVTRIAGWAFLECDSILSVRLPETIESIGPEAFEECTNLSEINLPSSLRIIEYWAFAFCRNLQEIELPDNVEKLGQHTFWECSNLTIANLGSGLTEVPEGLFQNCGLLKEVRLGENIERIGNSAFNCCYGLENIDFPDKLKVVGNNAFSYCGKLRELDLSNTDLRVMEDAAFQSCTNLRYVSLPPCLEQFSPLTFSGCSMLKAVEIFETGDHEETHYRSMDGCIFDANISTLIFVPANHSIYLPDSVTKLGDYCCRGNTYTGYIEIPENVSELGKYVFSNCQELYNVYFPPSITEIPEGTFQGCYHLNYVSFPENLERIGDYAFSNCEDLTQLFLPESLSFIGRMAFLSCWYLESVNLGTQIKEIGEWAFYECGNLNTFSCQSPLPTTEDYEIFSNYHIAEKGKLYVPYDYDEAYRFSPQWENFRYINDFHTVREGLAEEELATLIEVSEKLWDRGRGLDFYQNGPDIPLCLYGMVAEGGYITQIELPEYFWDNWNNMEFPVELLQFKHLRKLNLTDNNLVGNLDNAVEFLKENPDCGQDLQDINLSRNSLSGNIGPFGNAFPVLWNLDLSYNRFTDVYPMVPNAGILNIRHQDTDFISEISVNDILNGKFEGKFPPISAYNHWGQSFNKSFMMRITGPEDFYIEIYRTYDGRVGINRISSQNVFYCKKGEPLHCFTFDNYSSYYDADISFYLSLIYEDGDANFSGSFDIADIQAIINHIFGNNGTIFNFGAADLYADDIVNVQDVVVAVNMLLGKSLPDNKQEAQLETRSFATNEDPYIYISNGEVILSSEIPLNALHLMHTGNINWDLEALGLTQTEENGKVVAYSMTGGVIPAGETVIGHVLGNGCLLYAGAADSDANYLSIDISDADTAGISAVETHSAESLIYNLQGIPVAKDQLIPGNTYIKNGRKFIAK